MPASYDLTLLAQDDIDTVSDDIADMAEAVRWVGDIHDKLEWLGREPGQGHRRTDITRHDVFFWTFRSRWVVIYQKTTPIVIVRIVPWAKVTSGFWFGPGW